MARLITTSPGEYLTVGGNFDVFGLIGDGSTINVWSGSADRPSHIRLDASFNQGGDTIRLGGAAMDWTVRLDGSRAILEKEDTSVSLPLSYTNVVVEFADISAFLWIDALEDVAKIGEQVITSTAEMVDRYKVDPIGVSSNLAAQVSEFDAAGYADLPDHSERVSSFNDFAIV
jgi:hypothetical protein